VEVAVKTHIGHIRQVNEDSAAVFYRENVMLALVADGMGGHQAGDVASQMALEKIKQAFDTVELSEKVAAWEDWLLKTIQESNQFIYEYAINHDTYHGMGTTIVSALFLPDFFIITHVGDSRLYRYTREKLEAITADHSLVNELLRSGQITKEEAEIHPQRNVITRALGTEETVEVEIQTLSYIGDEYVLLCSDGFSNSVTEEQMISVLAGEETVEVKASKFIDLALEAGGDDNITLILIKTKGDELEQE
jgi:serine/threonine protein phosphatase PrpC